MMPYVKIKALTAIQGKRFQLALFLILPVFLYLSAFICFAYMCFTLTAGFSAVFFEWSFSFLPKAILTPVVSAVLFCDACLLTLCGASLSFFARARVFACVTANGSASKSLLSVKTGARYLAALFLKAVKINGKSLVLLVPFTINVLFAYIWLTFWGMTRTLLWASVGIVSISLLLSAVGIFIVYRRFSPLCFVLWQNPLMPIKNALSAAQVIGSNNLKRLMLCRIGQIPLRLCCITGVACFWFLPYMLACLGVVCNEKNSLTEL